ncbi:uncharacterized protein LOC124839689 [Vigna umbellata]|uniref:uncharacterized protein LOC124839689 n=1 Tax=Vigna umbellata TaxID=87088 RepID=UPI001F5FB75C|nr:uncharacterized protein LOC124839689 [Vigna umbellata]
MQQKYQGSTRVKRAQLQALRREFELLGMKEGEKVDTYLGRTLIIVNKMKSNGEESNDLNTLSLDELHGSLLVHEQRMQDSHSDEQVLKVIQEERPVVGRGRGRGRGRGMGRGRYVQNKAHIECFYCHKLGHCRYECPELEKKAHYASFEEGETEEEILLVAYEETQIVQKEDWFLDSGCSNHMTGNKLWFTKIQEEGLNRTVKLGNDSTLAVTAKRECSN